MPVAYFHKSSQAEIRWNESMQFEVMVVMMMMQMILAMICCAGCGSTLLRLPWSSSTLATNTDPATASWSKSMGRDCKGRNSRDR